MVLIFSLWRLIYIFLGRFILNKFKLVRVMRLWLRTTSKLCKEFFGEIFKWAVKSSIETKNDYMIFESKCTKNGYEWKIFAEY